MDKKTLGFDARKEDLAFLFGTRGNQSGLRKERMKRVEGEVEGEVDEVDTGGKANCFVRKRGGTGVERGRRERVILYRLSQITDTGEASGRGRGTRGGEIERSTQRALTSVGLIFLNFGDNGKSD